MITLKNLSCKSIIASSPALMDFITNPSDYNSLNISLQKNCCDNIYNDTILANSIVQNSYKINLPIVAGLIVKEVWFKNIVTGISFKVSTVNNVSITNSSNFIGITTSINTFFQSNFNNATTITSTQINVPVYVYTLAAVPTNFSPEKIVYTYTGGIETTEYFISSLSNKNTVASSINSGLIINPQIMDDILFEDGIYTIKTEVISDNGSTITETNCIFVDCTTKCKIADVLPNLNNNEKIEVLMLHYSLVNATNCSCNCKELCDVYTQLYKYIGTTIVNSGCNCNVL